MMYMIVGCLAMVTLPILDVRKTISQILPPISWMIGLSLTFDMVPSFFVR